MQHFGKSENNAILKTRFSDTPVHIRAPRSIAPIGKPPPLLDAFANKVFSAEASWLYKIADEGFSLRSYDDPNFLFKRCSLIAELFTLSRETAFYVICDGWSSWLVKQICSDVRNSTSTFTFMFDETTTKQNNKQMNMLLR